MHGYSMGGMWLWWLLPLLIVAAAVFIVSGRSSENGRSRALKILDERLAKGEIDTETYEKLKEELLRDG
jgi:putative membrane protein